MGDDINNFYMKFEEIVTEREDRLDEYEGLK